MWPEDSVISKMLVVFIVLPFFLVNAELDRMAKVAFKQSNREYNPNLVSFLNGLGSEQGECYKVRLQKWSSELEKKALDYLNSGGNVEEDMMIIKGERQRYMFRTYRKNSSLNIGIKLLDAFYGLMWYETEKIRNLPKGSQYGCNIVYKEGLEKDVLRYACLYKKN